MKKLMLRALALGAKEVLTREQIKLIMGGRSAGGDICVDSFTAFDNPNCSEGSRKYACCTSIGCSACIVVEPGTHVVCAEGALTAC